MKFLYFDNRKILFLPLERKKFFLYCQFNVVQLNIVLLQSCSIVNIASDVSSIPLETLFNAAFLFSKNIFVTINSAEVFLLLPAIFKQFLHRLV